MIKNLIKEYFKPLLDWRFYVTVLISIGIVHGVAYLMSKVLLMWSYK